MPVEWYKRGKLNPKQDKIAIHKTGIYLNREVMKHFEGFLFSKIAYQDNTIFLKPEKSADKETYRIQQKKSKSHSGFIPCPSFVRHYKLKSKTYLEFDRIEEGILIYKESEE